MNYETNITAAIAEDSSRTSWTLSQWRAYYLAEVTAIPRGQRATSTGILNTLGPVAGAALVSNIEAASPVVGKLLAPSEEGLDITHPSTPEFFAGLVAAQLATQEQIDAVLASYERTMPRHAYLGLPEPRERVLSQALEEIQ